MCNVAKKVLKEIGKLLKLAHQDHPNEALLEIQAVRAADDNLDP